MVWFTDLVGYSDLSARDQDRALALVQRFQHLVSRTVPTHEGRVVKFVGDAALIESPSAEAAIGAAAALHADMGEGLRTGIHLGDVAVAADGDLYGDGVNGAQRIQSAAEPGQIVVSEDVWRRLRNRPAFAFESLGERALKGVEPMELFRVVSAESGSKAAPARTEIETTQRPRSIAVLPFTNMSPHADNEYFSDGVTEEILALLARIEGLKVISRTSVMQYKGTVKPMRQIGEELVVATILEGSVRHAGSRVRITAQLIDAATDEHLWADRYDRDLEDIFAIQSDVAERIVEALRMRLTSRERSRLGEKPTDSVEAYEWHLKGRHFLARRTDATLRQAVDCFRQAVTADPRFALAWVGLADGLALLPIYGPMPFADIVDEARSAAEKALSLDPRLGEAHVSLGFIASLDWKWEEAERHFRRGLELSPGYVTGHHWYAIVLSTLRRHADAEEALQRALELDPLSLPVHMGLGATLDYGGKHEKGRAVYRKAIALDPGYVTSYFNLAESYWGEDQIEDAIETLETVSRIAPSDFPPEMARALRDAYAAEGAPGFWRAAIEEWGARADLFGRWSYEVMAVGCVRLGRTDEAFEHLARFRDKGNLAWHRNPALDPIRSDPRFVALMEEIGLPDPTA